MPAPPVLGGGLGEEGPLEVFRHLDPQTFRRADGYVDPAGEIGVQSDGVHAHQSQNIDPLVFVRAAGERADHRHQAVRHHQLFEKTPQHSLQAEGNAGRVPTVLCQQRRSQRVIAADGTLNELWEEGDKQSEFSQISLGRVFVPVDIQQVAHGLEDIEGDAHGQQKMGEGDGFLPAAQQTDQAVDIPQQEIGVLYHRQRTEVEGDAAQHP